MRIKKQTRATSYLYMLINVLTWGAFLPIVKFGFEGSSISPFRYLLYRFGLASFLALPILLYYFPRIKNLWKTLRTILLIELLGTSIALGFLYTGLTMTSSIEANLIATTLPIWITIGGILLLRERETRVEWAGLAIATLGTLFLVAEPVLNGMVGSSGTLRGNMFIVGHNIVTTVYFLLAKKFYKNIPKLFVSSVSFLVGLVTFGIAVVLDSGTATVALMQTELSSPLILAVIGYAAVFGSIIGLTAYFKGQDGIEASEASLFSYLQPIVYVPLGFFLLRERITPLQIAALLIVITGVVVAQTRVTPTLARNRK